MNLRRLAVLGLLSSVLCLAGCQSTVTPARVEAAQASFDGGAQNSGFLGFLADGSGHLTPHARDRYNALIAAGYGRDFLVPLVPDAGVARLADGTYQISAQHLTAFLVMSEKRRAGLPPKTP